MDILQDFLLQLPTILMTSINQKFTLLNKAFNGNVFTSRNSLDERGLLGQSLYFNIFLKQKSSKILEFQGSPMSKAKGAIEQIELQVKIDPSIPAPKEGNINRAALLSKMYLIQKSLSNFLINSPLFSFLYRMNYPEIQPSDFEASLTFRQEIDRTTLDSTWIQGLRIENYIISVGLFAIPSQAAQDVVKEYLTALDSTMEFRNYLQESDDEEKNPNNKSWDHILDPIDFRVETQENGEEKERDAESKTQNLLSQTYILAKGKKGKGEKKEDDELDLSLAERPKTQIEVEEKKEKDKFLVTLFEFTKELKKYTEEINPEKDTIGEILSNEKKFYEELKNSV